MNKDLIDQLPPDERPVASKLNSLAGDMQIPPGFQSDLENQLMEKAKTTYQPSQSLFTKIIPALGWTLLAVCAVVLLNWSIRSLVPETQPAAGLTPVPEGSFETSLRQGDICAGPLALAHGLNVFLTNEDKTGFVPVDTGNSLGELRSFAWSADGERLAVVGNTTGSGNIYITDPTGGETGYLLSASEAGYLRDAAWSRNGRQIVLWSSQNITTLYLLSTLGHGLVEKQLDVQILGTPQFAPDGNIFFYGADRTAAGLFTVSLEPSQPFLLMPEVEDESGFAFSPDGSLLAYIEYDRVKGEVRLSTQKPSKGEYRLLGTLTIPRNPGASLPEAANLSWSPDGTFIVFDFGQFASQHAIYLARADGGGLIPIIESGYAPTISSDGRCLAYISNKQVFLLDLAEVASNSRTATPVLLADLPTRRGTPNFKQDKLQWRP